MQFETPYRVKPCSDFLFTLGEVNEGKKGRSLRKVKPSYFVREAPRKIIDNLNNKTSAVRGREKKVGNKQQAWDLGVLVYLRELFAVLDKNDTE